MQQLQQALLLKKLYLLKSMDFHYCDVYFKKPTQKSFQSNNAKDLHSSIQACQLCSQKLSKPHTGLCNPNSKITFISTTPILDTQLRFASKGAQIPGPAGTGQIKPYGNPHQAPLRKDLGAR